MGYDMYLVAPVDGEAEAIQAAESKLAVIRAALDEIGDQKGTWTAPGEDELPEEERATLSRRRSERRNELMDSGVDLILAALLAQGTPASEEYVHRTRARLAAADEVDRARVSYFRLNIWGMSRYADEMAQLGMLKPGPSLSEEWPKPSFDQETLYALIDAEDLGGGDRSNRSNRGDLDAVRKGLPLLELDPPLVVTEEMLVEYQRYSLTVAAHLATHDTSTLGIGDNKFSSNDGWHVTAEECAGALKVWADTPEVTKAQVRDKRGDYWDRWLAFLAYGRDGDGFRVH